MKLTPIRIKSKRGQPPKKRWSPPDPEGYAKRKRDAASAANEDESSRDSGSASRQTKRQKGPKSPATVETFPAEILERITIMSENVNFVRSSLRIGKLLSHRSFYLQLLLGSFRPTWESIILNKVPRGSPRFQSEVLANPWMNLNLMLEAQEMWDRECKSNPSEEFASIRHPSTTFDSDWALFMGECGAIVNKYSTTGSSPGPSDHPPFPDSLDFPSSSALNIHPKTKIPDKLLSGSPDWDKAKFLFWLIRAGARIHPDQPYELTRDGYDRILSKGRGNEDDRFLASVMLWLFKWLNVFGVGGHWPAFLVTSKMEECEGRDGIDAFAWCILSTQTERETLYGGRRRKKHSIRM
ncbi:hypothetical protein QBC44DRAFT_328099 [Cladorrhinum sp. PSN332]|nr:hypothetical protein QBC44DRAFT_328099 [Cladorrhinum sp. PSN332]